MPFTIFHIFINYLIALPVRKRIDIIGLIIGSALPDVEGLYFTAKAYEICGSNINCLTEYPSHFIFHSFLGAFLIVAPLGLGISFYLRKYLKMKPIDLKVIYMSALGGALLHYIPDLTVHKGADALYLFWPMKEQFSFSFASARIFWIVIAVIGLGFFIFFERKKLRRLKL